MNNINAWFIYVYWFKFGWTAFLHSHLSPQSPSDRPEGPEAVSSSDSLKRKSVKILLMESLSQGWEEEVGSQRERSHVKNLRRLFWIKGSIRGQREGNPWCQR